MSQSGKVVQINYLPTLNSEWPIIIAGVDATPDAIEYLGEGLDVTVYQNMVAQGYNGAKAAYDLIKGNPVEKWDWIPFETVTPENMEDYK